MTTAAISDPVAVIDGIVSPWMTQWQTPGVAIAIYDPTFPSTADGLVLPYGTTSLEGDLPPVIADTVFELGSVTKVFTSLLLALAQGKGLCSLEHSAAEYLPGLQVTGGFNAVTLQQLATHIRPERHGPRPAR